MATITIWRGYRHWDWNSESDYENISFDGVEVGAVRFTDTESDIQYRIYRYTENEGEILVYVVKREGHYCEAELYEFPSLEDAMREYKFVLKKAGVI